MNGVQTRFKCKLDVKRCKRFVFPPSSLLPRSNALKTKAIRYFQTDRTLTRIVSPPLRKRWIAAQYGALRASLPDFPKALIQGNIDYCDKILQWMLPPRLIQLAGVFGFTLLFTAIGLLMSLQSGGYEWYTAIKWWILSAAQVAAMIIPVPGKLLNRKLGKAILQIPTLALAMIANMFRLKGANKKFIHTEHGEE